VVRRLTLQEALRIMGSHECFSPALRASLPHLSESFWMQAAAKEMPPPLVETVWQCVQAALPRWKADEAEAEAPRWRSVHLYSRLGALEWWFRHCCADVQPVAALVCRELKLELGQSVGGGDLAMVLSKVLASAPGGGGGGDGGGGGGGGGGAAGATGATGATGGGGGGAGGKNGDSGANNVDSDGSNG
ncbi:MAG: hypothetical protein ACK4YT_13990, partial [Sphingomonas sp.]